MRMEDRRSLGATTRKPVFRSCEVVPPLEQAMHTMPPMEKPAVTYHWPPVQPTIRKTRQVSISVAMVMPEMGLDVEPTSPVRRDDTVTNSAPSSTMSTAPSRFMCSDGAAMMTASSTRMPMPTNFSGMSCWWWSVLPGAGRGAARGCPPGPVDAAQDGAAASGSA